MNGTLYLVPTPLDFGCLPDGHEAPSLREVLPDTTVQTAAGISHWIAENAKSTRAFLKRVASCHPLTTTLQMQSITELPRAIHKQGDHRADGGMDAQAKQWLQPAMQGMDIGLISEAGMPAIADPGSSVVRAAHAMGLAVVPLVGPISLMLALAASGLNGQHFAFVGYVPHDPQGRAKRLKELENTAQCTGQTQILIETPYRNAALMQALLSTLQPRTRLAVACGMTLHQQWVRSGPVADWRQKAWGSELPADLPCIFLVGA